VSAGDFGGFSFPAAHEFEADRVCFEVRHAEGDLDGLFRGLGSGLFCQFRDFGENGDLGHLRGGEFGGAEGAVGLENAELMDGAVIRTLRTGLIAGEAVEDRGLFAAEEVLDVSAADFGFDAAEALEVPGGVEDLLEGKGLEGTLRGELGFEGVAKSCEVFLFIGADDEVFGGESVLERVPGDAGFALGVTGPVEWRALARLAVI
jgi:hypothetical protein